MQIAIYVPAIFLVALFAGCADQGAVPAPNQTPETGWQAENWTGSAAKTYPVDKYGDPSPDGDYKTDGPWSMPLMAGPHKILPGVVEELESEVDGATIQVAYYRPDTDEASPVILMPAPYYQDFSMGEPMLACTSRGLDLGAPGPCRVWIQGIVEAFVPHGYTVALIAARGTGGSGGCFFEFSPAEIADVDQAVTWFAEQEWSSGRVAIYALSAGGFVAYGVAALGNPALVTILPFAALPSWREWYVRNGTQLYEGMHWDHIARATLYEAGVQQGRSPAGLADAPCPERQDAATARLAINQEPYSDMNGYWSDRDWREGLLQNYEGSVFWGAGRLDRDPYWYGAAEIAEELRKKGNLVYMIGGQWGHMLPDADLVDSENNGLRHDWAELLLRWFDHELKGPPGLVGKAVGGAPATKLWAPVQIQDMLGQWRVQVAYPAPGTQHAVYPIADMELIDPGLGGEALPTNFFGHDFTPVGGIVHEMRLHETIRFSGTGEVNLKVRPTGPGGVVGIEIVHQESDQAMFYADLNLAYRDGTTIPQQVVPGETYDIRLVLRHGDGVVPAGDAFEVRINMSSRFFEPTPWEMYPVEILDGGDVVLPVLPEDGIMFFDPPACQSCG